MRTEASLESEIRRLLVEVTLDDAPRTAPADAALDAIGVDSVGMIQLVFQLEETFGVAVEDSEVTAENFASIASLVRLMERKCSS